MTNEDIDKLLALPVRRIARFDIEKNQQELREIDEKIKKIRHKLLHLIDYTIDVLSEIKKKYGENFPRRTEIENIEQIDRKAAALNNIKVGWDRRNGYVGTGIKSDDTIVCNEYDRLVCIEKSGKYRVIPMVPEKLFLGKLYDFRKYDSETQFGVIYRETKSGKYYGKRTSIGGFILEKEYMLCPAGCKLELLTPRADAIYLWSEEDGKGKVTTREINLMEFPVRAPKARGLLIGGKTMTKVTHSRYLTEEEIAALVIPDDPEGEEPAEDTAEETVEEVTPAAEEEKKVPVPKEIMAIVAAAKESAKKAVLERPEMPSVIPPSVAETPAAEPEKVTEEPAVEQEKVTEEVTDVPSDREPEVAEETVGTPVAEPEKMTEDAAEETFALDDSDTALPKKRTRKPVQEKPAKPVADDADEFGMIQPDFGF